MSLPYIKIFVDCLESIEPLDDGERGRLFTALLEYARTGEKPVLEGNERFLFPMLRSQLDRDAASYEGLCAMNAKKGAMGGRPPKKAAAFSESRKSQEKEEEKDKDKEEDKDKDKDSSLGGASRPARREKRANGFSPGPRREDPARARRDLDRMEGFLRELQRERQAAEAAEQAAEDGPPEEGP